MTGLDIVLINVISYLGGILSGIYIHHKMNKNKKCRKDNSDKKNEDNSYNDNKKDYDITQVYNSPILAATAVPNAPPPMNPNYINSGSPMKKRITITTE